METLQLIQGLYNNDTGVRHQSALVIGMVQETSAIGALEQRYREEPDATIKDIVLWAGRRAQQGQRQGFSTIDAIFKHFQINRELASGIDPEEADALRHQVSITDTHSTGGALGGIRLGSMMTAEHLKTGNLAGERRLDPKAVLRLPPVKITDTDISLKIKRLMDSSNPRRQKLAALELGDINNPKALPYLARLMYQNQNAEPALMEVVERIGKQLYWNFNYATMEKNGRLNIEIAKRRRDGQFPAPSAQVPVAQTESVALDVNAILDQAQKNRKKRRR